MAATNNETTASTSGSTPAANVGTPVTGADLTADNLIGTSVYGPDNQTIGSIGDIALTPEGQVDAVIVDVGGFLGIGAKPVAVAMDNLQFMRDSGGSLTLTTQFTQDQLRNAPSSTATPTPRTGTDARRQSGRHPGGPGRAVSAGRDRIVDKPGKARLFGGPSSFRAHIFVPLPY